MDSRSLLKATLAMYRDCAVDAAKVLLLNWKLPLMSVAAFIAFMASALVFSRFGMAGGFILGIINIVLLTFYYRWISECVRHTTLSWRDYFEFSYPLFSAVINTAFVLYIAQFVLGSLTTGLNALPLISCVNLGVFVLFNALPEVIYLRGAQGMEAFAESFRFVKDSWIEWFLPLALLFSPLIAASPMAVLLSLSSGEALLPALKFVQLIGPMVSSLVLAAVDGGSMLVQLFISILCILIATWFMLFRGFLYRELESGSRRQRAFRASQR